MISIERFNEIVQEELALLPAYVFDELNGGVVVDEQVNLHPDRLADDLYIMGTYSTSPIMGKQIVIYYGSFARTMPHADEETLRLKIRNTIRHEFRHHMETRAGFFGRGTLIDEDKQDMARYFLMHARKDGGENVTGSSATGATVSSPEGEAADEDAYSQKESETWSGSREAPAGNTPAPEIKGKLYVKEASPGPKITGRLCIKEVTPPPEIKGRVYVREEPADSRESAILPGGFEGVRFVEKE